MTIITEELKAKAEMYYGDEICREKSKFLLKEVGLPGNLLPLKDIEECGYIEETGFVWLKQKKKSQHCFEKIGKPVSYAPEITAYVDKLKIKKLTGVKAKELLLWITINDITVEEPCDNRKLTFKTPAGLFRSYPFSAFDDDDDKDNDKGKEKENEKEKEKEMKENDDKK